jgi:hypothetical protein
MDKIGVRHGDNLTFLYPDTKTQSFRHKVSELKIKVIKTHFQEALLNRRESFQSSKLPALARQRRF